MTMLGRLVSLAVASAAVMAALAVLLPALDQHRQLKDELVPPRHRLPANCLSAHEAWRDSHVVRLCDFYEPTPRPAPTPHPQVKPT